MKTKTVADKLNEKHTGMKRPPIAVNSFFEIVSFTQPEIGQILRDPKVQTKLIVGSPNDVYEKEADQAAEQVMRMPESFCYNQPTRKEVKGSTLAKKLFDQKISTLQKQKVLKEETVLQAQATRGRALQISSLVTTQIDAVRQQRGQPLPEGVRSFFESRFGYDFSLVRVHTDAQAAESAQALNAQAYTVGRDVVFGAGQYAPETDAGRSLLAHELAHTIQQQSCKGSIGNLQGAVGAASPPGQGTGAQTLPVQPVSVRSHTAPLIQRQERGTYVSTLGPRAYLDAGFQFYRSWGHPNVRRVSNIQEILDDLDRGRGTIQTFRIVSHAGPAGLQLGLMPTLEPEHFGEVTTQYTTEQRFRNEFSLLRLINEIFSARLIRVLREDQVTSPLLSTIEGEVAAPIAVDSDLDIMLRAILEDYWLRTVRLDTGEAPDIHHRQVLDDFNTQRLNTYRALLVRNVPPRQRRAVTIAITRLIQQVPAALQRANIVFDPITQAEAVSLADPVTDQQVPRPRLRRDIATSIREGAGGPYLRRLRSVRAKINENTHVEIAGCNVGANVNFLDAMRRYFGSPGHLPSISAPDLYQYFFSLGFTTYSERAGDEQDLQALWDTPETGVAQSYEEYQRRQAREMLRSVVLTNQTTSLAAFVQRYGLTINPNQLFHLNPEISDPDRIPGGTAVWLIPRSTVAVGRYHRLEDFCRDYIGNQYVWPRVWAVNPSINDPEGLQRHDILQVPADLLPRPIASAAPTFEQFRERIRGGQAFVSFDPQTGSPVARLDDRQRARSIADWLASQRFDPRGRTAAALARFYRRNFQARMANTWIQFLSRTYPGIVDPIFPEDLRFSGHIIRRP